MDSAQLTNPVQSAVRTVFGDPCCCCDGSSSCRTGDKERQVVIIADAGVMAPPMNNAICTVGGDSASYKLKVLLSWERWRSHGRRTAESRTA